MSLHFIRRESRDNVNCFSSCSSTAKKPVGRPSNRGLILFFPHFWGRWWGLTMRHEPFSKTIVTHKGFPWAFPAQGKASVVRNG